MGWELVKFEKVEAWPVRIWESHGQLQDIVTATKVMRLAAIRDFGIDTIRVMGTGAMDDFAGDNCHRLESPASPMAAGLDRHVNPPSGEVSSVGDAPEPKGPGDEVGEDPQLIPSHLQSQGRQELRDWRRSLEFWLGGEGHQTPEEFIGPRIMVQLSSPTGEAPDQQ